VLGEGASLDLVVAFVGGGPFILGRVFLGQDQGILLCLLLQMGGFQLFLIHHFQGFRGRLLGLVLLEVLEFSGSRLPFGLLGGFFLDVPFDFLQVFLPFLLFLLEDLLFDPSLLFGVLGALGRLGLLFLLLLPFGSHLGVALLFLLGHLFLEALDQLRRNIWLRCPLSGRSLPIYQHLVVLTDTHVQIGEICH